MEVPKNAFYFADRLSKGIFPKRLNIYIMMSGVTNKISIKLVAQTFTAAWCEYPTEISAFDFVYQFAQQYQEERNAYVTWSFTTEGDVDDYKVMITLPENTYILVKFSVYNLPF